MVTTIAFDLDDTLYDEVDYCRSGFGAAARHLASLSDTRSPDDIFASLWGQFTAGNRTQTFNAALTDLGIAYDQELIRQLIQVYRTHVPTLALPPATRSTLDALKGDYTLALLTDGFLPAQKLKVRALGLEDDFQAIVYTEELGRQFWKPSPRGFEKLLEKLNVTPSQAVYVADNETKDFIAPNQLGLATIQVLRPARLHTETSAVPNAAAQHKIQRIREITAILHQL